MKASPCSLVSPFLPHSSSFTEDAGWQTTCFVRELHRFVMKFAIFALTSAVSMAATCVLYGWLESTVNMIEGFRQLFAPGATTVVFSPFLLLFIALCLGVFIGASLLVVAIAAVMGGLLLRSRAITVPRSFTRSFVFVAVACQFAFMLFAIDQNAPFLLRRPRAHPTAPAYILACLAGANSAFNLSLAALIIRKLTAKT